MNKPDLIGIEVLTPDGRGSISSLYSKGAVVVLNTIAFKQKMKGREQHKGGMHYFYKYDVLEIIKGRYCFNDKRIMFQYS